MGRRVALWAASLVAVAGLTTAVLWGQSRLLEREYRLLSGEDVGFRIEGTDGSGRPFGTLMLRVDGQWVEVGSWPALRRVS
jgi:hypothetical protein